MEFRRIYKYIRRHALVGILCLIALYVLCPRTLEGYDNQDLRKIHHVLLKIWGRTQPIFEKHRIHYWAHAGTLLGSVREGKIIEWDDDMDLGVEKDTYRRLQTDPALLRDMDDAGLHILRRDRSDNGLLKIVMKRSDNDYTKDKVFIDIMCYHLEGDKYIFSCLKERKWWPHMYYNRSEVDTLVKRPLNHLHINTSSQAEACLRRFYGDDWKTPKKDHDHEKEVNLQ